MMLVLMYYVMWTGDSQYTIDVENTNWNNIEWKNDVVVVVVVVVGSHNLNGYKHQIYENERALWVWLQ